MLLPNSHGLKQMVSIDQHTLELIKNEYIHALDALNSYEPKHRTDPTR